MAQNTLITNNTFQESEDEFAFLNLYKDTSSNSWFYTSQRDGDFILMRDTLDRLSIKVSDSKRFSGGVYKVTWYNYDGTPTPAPSDKTGDSGVITIGSNVGALLVTGIPTWAKRMRIQFSSTGTISETNQVLNFSPAGNATLSVRLNIASNKPSTTKVMATNTVSSSNTFDESAGEFNFLTLYKSTRNNNWYSNKDRDENEIVMASHPDRISFIMSAGSTFAGGSAKITWYDHDED